MRARAKRVLPADPPGVAMAALGRLAIKLDMVGASTSTIPPLSPSICATKDSSTKAMASTMGLPMPKRVELLCILMN